MLKGILLAAVSISNVALAQMSAEEAIKAMGSTPFGNLENMQVIMDNDRAAQSQLEILRKAEAGDKVFLGYYIHGDDESTSAFNQEAINAAKRGVNVYILDDFLTNYKRLDMFNMLEREGSGRIHVRFFNPPTWNIHRDVIYMTSSCNGGANCAEEKKELLQFLTSEKERLEANSPLSSKHLGPGTFFSKLFLAGLSAKNAAAMKLAVSAGGTLSAMAQGDGKKMSDEDKSNALEFGKLLFGAKVLGNTTDKVKLTLAFLLMGDQIGDKYEAIDAALPIDIPHDSKAGKDWEDLTDFLHHKFLTLFKKDGRVITQHGGRNKENSYAINENLRHLVEKYLFFDTDVRYESTDPTFVTELKKSIAYLFGYNEMVVTLKQVNEQLPVDLVANLDLVQQAIEKNKALRDNKKISFYEYDKQVEATFAELARGRAQERQNAAKTKMEAGAQKYLDERKNAEGSNVKQYSPSIIAALGLEDKDAKAMYIENLPFYEEELGNYDKLMNEFASTVFGQFLGLKKIKPKKLRAYDPIPGQELKYNKNIHAAWVEVLKKTAVEAAAKKEKATVIIHQGYALLPAILVDVIGQMIRGEINAEYLEIKVVTNSIETTDLNMINVFARHQFKAVAEYFEQNRGRPGALASLRIFEHLILPDGNKTSLHSKALYAPNDIIISSANLDVRSYEMDTNNGTWFTNVPSLGRRLIGRLERDLLGNPGLVREATAYYRQNHNQFLKEDRLILEKIIGAKQKLAARLAKYIPQLAAGLQERMLSLYLATGLVLDYDQADLIFGRTSVTSVNALDLLKGDNDGSGGGGGGKPSKNLICKSLFGEVTARKYNSHSVIEKMRGIKSRHGNKGTIMRFLDQVLSTL